MRAALLSMLLLAAGCGSGRAEDACVHVVGKVYRARADGDLASLKDLLGRAKPVMDEMLRLDAESGFPGERRTYVSVVGDHEDYFSVSLGYRVQLQSGDRTELFECRVSKDDMGAMIVSVELGR